MYDVEYRYTTKYCKYDYSRFNKFFMTTTCYALAILSPFESYHLKYRILPPPNLILIFIIRCHCINLIASYCRFAALE